MDKGVWLFAYASLAKKAAKKYGGSVVVWNWIDQLWAVQRGVRHLRENGEFK